MELNFKRLLVASVTGGSIMIGCTAMASGLSLPQIDTPASASTKTPAISTPAVSTPTKTTPSESIWADVPSVTLPVNGVGMSGEVHDWNLDQPPATPGQHVQLTIPAVTVPSISVPSKTVPSINVNVALPASAHADPNAGTADATAHAGDKTVEASLR